MNEVTKRLLVLYLRAVGLSQKQADLSAGTVYRLAKENR